MSLRRSALIIAGQLLPAAPLLAAPCPPLPPLQTLRYDEHYAPRPADCPAVFPETLKALPVGPLRLDLGGEWRVRLEASDVPAFGLAGPSDRAVLNRLLLRANVQASDEVRLFVQMGSFLASRHPATSPTDVSRLDLAQGFVELRTRQAGITGTLRLGRQEVAYGSSRLISVRDSPNIRRSFDGARLSLGRDRLTLDGFWLRPVTLSPGVFDDASNRQEAVFGIYAAHRLGQRRSGGIDLYWIGFERAAGRFLAGRAREVRHSFGGRLFGSGGGFDWDVEPVLQVGRFGSGRIRAWTLATNVGRRLADLPGTPRLGLKADIASGDGQPGDGVLRTFNALYPRLPYFTEANLAVPSNILDLHPSASFDLASAGRLTLGANLLWRHRRADAVYIPPLLPGLAPTSGDRFVGTQWEAGWEWQPRRGLELKLFLVRFAASDATRRVGGRSGTFAATSLGYRF